MGVPDPGKVDLGSVFSAGLLAGGPSYGSKATDDLLMEIRDNEERSGVR